MLTAAASITTAAALLLTTTACTQDPQQREAGPPVHSASSRQRTGQPRAVADALVRHRVVLGYTVAHRSIIGVELGDPDSPRRVLVVGCIHGNEPAGITITRALAARAVPAEIDLWLIPDLNPDGVAAGTRGNAHGVDLNRNFPYRWQSLGPPGSLHYAGPHAASEPETRLALTLLRRVRPTLGIWYHQALDVVDSSQGPLPLERRYAADSGLALRRLPDYPGSAVGYEDHMFGPTAFVIELPAGNVSDSALSRHVHAVLDVATHAQPTSP